MPSAARSSASASSSSLELLTIYEVSKILGSSLDLEQTLREVLRALSYQLQMHRGRVYLQGEDSALRLVAAHGLSKEALAHAKIETTMKYAHPRIDDVRRGLNATAASLAPAAQAMEKKVASAKSPLKVPAGKSKKRASA